MTSFIDAAGVTHMPADSDFRIVSLVPSLTELLFDLGLDDAVVGRTAFCVHPNRRVRSAQSVGGTKTINFEKLKALAPTHIIVNIDETPRQLAETLTKLNYEVVVTHPIEVADNRSLYHLIGGLFGRTDEAQELCAQFDRAYERTVDAAMGTPERRVLYLIWKDPWMTVSRETYISRTLAIINWHTEPAITSERYPITLLNNQTLEDVDLVLFSSEPFPFKKQHLNQFRHDFPLHQTKARLVDGQMLSWYGSRAIKALDYLRSLLVSHDL
ncbi:MAG: ABC transporter substrate-binding protein [Hyphomicrobiales bacterium]|nr:ABC transporter substrate-binding protein [Hyphomicrobiales bacterium]